MYTDLISDYGGSTDPKVRRHVAWALNNRAWTLKEGAQRDEAIATYDELISTFRDAAEPGIRQRVNWALWNKARMLSDASNDAQAELAYEQLIGRHDDGFDVELDRNVAWAIERDAWALGQAGQLTRQLDRCNELLERFGDTRDAGLLRNVLGVMSQRADVLAKLGRSAQAVEANEQIATKFNGATDVELRDGVVISLISKGALLAGMRRTADAVSAYDNALALLADVTEPVLLERVVTTLVSKGDVLRRSERLEEAIVVYDSAGAAYHRATDAGSGAEVLWAAVLASFYKVDLLCTLDRANDVQEVRAQLGSMLDDVSADALPHEPSERAAASERELAETFARVVAGDDSWRFFDAPDSEIHTTKMADRAVELYRLSEPWTLDDEEKSGLAAQAAAGMIRDVADGYAMLSRPLDQQQRRALPLPQRQQSQRAALIRRFGIDEWAAHLGWPLDIPERDDDIGGEELSGKGLTRTSTTLTAAPDEFLRFFVASAYGHELLAMLCDSPTGREALGNIYFKHYAGYRIAEARRWVHRLRLQVPDATNAAIAAVLMAEAFFLASHGAVSSSGMLVPSMFALRDQLRGDGTHDWLHEQGLHLPMWLEEGD